MPTEQRRGLRARAIVDAMRLPMIVLDGSRRVLHANRAYRRAFGTRRGDAFALPMTKAGDAPWNDKALLARIRRVISHGEAFQGLEISFESATRGRRSVLIEGVRFGRKSRLGPMILLTFDDNTVRRSNEAALRLRVEELTRSNAEFEAFVDAAAGGLLEPLNTLLGCAQMITKRHRLKDKMTAHLVASSTDIASTLTPREHDVLRLITDGIPNKAIAITLCIGRRTVEAHRQNLMMKLDIHTAAGLTKYALACGLISLA